MSATEARGIAVPDHPMSAVECARCGLVLGPVTKAGWDTIRPQQAPGDGGCRWAATGHRFKVV